MMTRELVALLAATLDASPDVSEWSEQRVLALVLRARELLREVQRQGIDRVSMAVRCDLCSREVVHPMTFEFDSRQWVLVWHEPLARKCEHVAAPLRFIVDFLEAPL